MGAKGLKQDAAGRQEKPDETARHRHALLPLSIGFRDFRDGRCTEEGGKRLWQCPVCME